MDKLKMMSADGVEGNIEKIGALFPNCVTERLDENGKVEKAIDFEMLKQELSHVVVDGAEERYQFTWPDKKKSILLANSAINKTLRPVVCDEQVPTGADTSGQPYTSSGSVGKNGEAGKFDSENLYIEGDNLDALKLLQETYMGKIKMIYIDPPYNTGNDFVYEDDFSMRNAEFAMLNEDVDEDGNRMVLNAESNGRFHTDWLNMIYPRLKLAKDLLSDDGIIFISIDDNEIYNLKKICDEIFGESNYLNSLVWKKNSTTIMLNKEGFSTCTESVLVYKKSIAVTLQNDPISERLANSYNKDDNDGRGKYGTVHLYTNTNTNKKVPLLMPDGTTFEAKWQVTQKTFDKYVEQGLVIKTPSGWRKKIYLSNCKGSVPVTMLDNEIVGTTKNGTLIIQELLGNAFSYPKPVELIKYLLSKYPSKHDIVLDFFSGSATTAHAVMQLNAEDGGNRKFIMVQLPEVTDEKSEAFKAGYKNICEIGKERIRRAGKKIAEQFSVVSGKGVGVSDGGQSNMFDKQNQPSSILPPTSSISSTLDIGFRVLKLDTTNMKDVYYRAENYSQSFLDNLEGNIKADRKPQDLLFQVMLDMGVLLSSKIEEKNFTMQNGQCVMVDENNKPSSSHLPSPISHLPSQASSISHLPSYTVFIVGDYSSNIQPNLIACFDDNLSNEVVTAIAKMKPLYAVFRDSSFANDSVATNFEQIFTTYSPTTTRKVI